MGTVGMNLVTIALAACWWGCILEFSSQILELTCDDPEDPMSVTLIFVSVVNIVFITAHMFVFMFPKESADALTETVQRREKEVYVYGLGPGMFRVGQFVVLVLLMPLLFRFRNRSCDEGQTTMIVAWVLFQGNAAIVLLRCLTGRPSESLLPAFLAALVCTSFQGFHDGDRFKHTVVVSSLSVAMVFLYGLYLSLVVPPSNRA